jgi:chromosome segregation ATPase
MRTVIALCFLALFAGALAHKSKAPIEESKLVSSLKGLFQIASADELDEVAEILAQVREEVEGVLSRVRNNYAQQEADHDDVVGQYQADIDSLSTELSQTKTDLDNAQTVASELQEAIDNSLSAIEEARGDQDVENARRTEKHNAFRSNIDQLNADVDAAQDALRLLQEIDTQDLSGSFLEINNKKIKSHFEALHKSLSSMKLKNSFTPITKMLVEIASAGINHELIAQIEDLLNSLIDSLNQEVNEAVADDNNDDSYSRNTLSTLQDTIDVESASADANQAKLLEVEATITLLNDAGSRFASTLSDAQAALAAKNSEWDDASSLYDALIKRLQRDIAALEAAETFVDRD